MGRRKIDIKPILNDRNRYTTFGKRKSGLFKKARELAVLCQVEIAVVIVSKKDNEKVFEYTNVNSVDEVVCKRNKIRDNHGSISRSYISEDGESVRDDDLSGDYDGEQDQDDDYASSGKASVASIKTENVIETSVPVEGHSRSHSRPKLKVQIPDSASDSGHSNSNTSTNLGNPSLRIMPPDQGPTNPHQEHENEGKANDPEAAAQMNQNMQVPPHPGMYPSPVYFGQFGPNGQPIQMTPTQGISPGNGSYFPGFTPLMPQGYYGYPLQPRYNGPYQMPGQTPGVTDPTDPAYRQSPYAAHPEADGEGKMPPEDAGHLRHPSQSHQGDPALQNTNGAQPPQPAVDSQGSKGSQKADGSQGPHTQNRNTGLGQQMVQHNEANRSHAAQSGANGPNTFLYKPNFPGAPGSQHHPANGRNPHQQGGPSSFPAGQQPQGGPGQVQNGKYVNDFLMSPTNYFSMEWGVWDPQASAGPNGSAKANFTPTTDENRAADESQPHRPPTHNVQQAAHSQGLTTTHPSARKDAQVNRNLSYNNDPSHSHPSNIPAKRESDQEPSIPAKQSKKEL